MDREEAATGVWIFRSRFADMLSSLIALDRERAALVDPPMFADEAEEIRGFAAEEGRRIEYLIITHAHGDHAYGMAHFPGALVIAQREFWGFWREVEAEDRAFFARHLPGYRPPELREPNIVFTEELRLLFRRRIVLWHAPGHTPDGLVVELPDEGILIAGDTVLPIPFVAAGTPSRLRATLEGILRRFTGGVLVPGHGEAVRDDAARRLLEENLLYLERLREEVGRALASGKALEEVERMPLEPFGIPEAAVGGLAAWIHRENLRAAYRELSGKR